MYLFLIYSSFQGSPTNNVSPTSTPAKSSNAVPTLQPPPAAGAAGDGAAAGPAASEAAEEYVSAEPLLYFCFCVITLRYSFVFLSPMVRDVLSSQRLFCLLVTNSRIILMLKDRCKAADDNMEPDGNVDTFDIKCHFLLLSSSLLDLDPLSSSGPSAPSAAPTSWGGKHFISFRSKTHFM